MQWVCCHTNTSALQQTLPVIRRLSASAWQAILQATSSSQQLRTVVEAPLPPCSPAPA